MSTERHEPPARWSYGWSATVDNQATANYPGGVTVGSPTGGDKGIGSGNFQTLWINGVAVSTGGGAPGGASGAIQYNNAGAFGGFGSTDGFSIVLANTAKYQWTGRSAISSGADGVITFANNAGTNSVSITVSAGNGATFNGGITSAGSVVAATGNFLAISTRTKFSSSADGLWIAQNNGGTAVATQIGTATNDSAAAGGIGEYLTQTTLVGTAVPLTTGVSANIATLPLQAGDYDVWGVVSTVPAGTTATVSITAGIGTASATLPGRGLVGQTSIYPNNAGGVALPMDIPSGEVRVTLAAPASVFLVANVQFSTSTMAAFGQIVARRRR